MKTNLLIFGGAFALCLLVVSGCVSTQGRVSLPPEPPAAAGPGARSPEPAAHSDDDDIKLERFQIQSSVQKHAFVSEPHSTKPVKVLRNIGYAVGFSEELRIPLWAGYYCGPVAEFSGTRPTTKFKEDTRVRADARLKHADYNRPPGQDPTFDRGHMAPSYGIGSRYGDDAQLETFKMTNIVPQRSTLNQVTWKGLEHLISKEMAEAYDGLWVLVGPILPNESELTWYNNKAAMPTAFYCILTDVDEDEMAHVIALILTQEDTGTRKLGEFMTTVDNVEKATGLDFFADLPDAEEVALESTVGDAGEWFGEETLIIP